ncbi:MAG TPA: M48 family metallopeptidase [Phycisphaerae bacterium]|nr:M48 family metallopeptidase [Phycisphaerae bacterium]
MHAMVLVGLIMALLAMEIAPEGPPPDVATTLGAVAAIALGVFVAGWVLGALALRRGAIEADEQRFFLRVGRAAKAYRLVVLLAYGIMLGALNWPALVAHLAGDKRMFLGFLLMAAPFLVLLVLSWTALYWADRRLRAFMFARAGVVMAGAAWTLPRYLVFLLRQYLLVVFVPLAALLAVHDLLVRFLGPLDSMPLATILLVGGVVAVAMLAGPWIRLCWRTERLPEGDLRRRLTGLAGRAGVRVGDILVWRTNLSIANGCMVGSVGPLRYILITDALLLALPNEELEAVFAHEVAHVKYHHVLLYMALAIGGMGAMILVGEAAAVVTHSSVALSLVTAAFLVAYWWLLFGFISRRCEAECDLFAVQATSCPEGCSPPEDDIRIGGDGASPPALCEHRVRAFTSALGRIARLNGSAETARGWRHFSVARRRRFLEQVLANPPLAERFARRMRRIKWMAVLGAVLAAAAVALLMLAAPASEADDSEDPAGPEDVLPPAHRWIVRFIDGDEMNAVALGAPQFDGDADAALEADDDGLSRFREGVAPGDDDVSVEDARGHAIAVHPEAERPGRDLFDARQVDELDASVGRRLG